MRSLLGRLAGYLPAAIALAIPTVFLPAAEDSFILPRASIVSIASGGICGSIAVMWPSVIARSPIALSLREGSMTRPPLMIRSCRLFVAAAVAVTV